MAITSATRIIHGITIVVMTLTVHSKKKLFLKENSGLNDVHYQHERCAQPINLYKPFPPDYYEVPTWP